MNSEKLSSCSTPNRQASHSLVAPARLAVAGPDFAIADYRRPLGNEEAAADLRQDDRSGQLVKASNVDQVARVVLEFAVCRAQRPAGKRMLGSRREDAVPDRSDRASLSRAPHEFLERSGAAGEAHRVAPAVPVSLGRVLEKRAC